VHDIQAQEEQADKNGETELQRSSKFLDLQQDIEGREHRLQLRLAECSGS
jgi:hypothetical protein